MAIYPLGWSWKTPVNLQGRPQPYYVRIYTYDVLVMLSYVINRITKRNERCIFCKGKQEKHLHQILPYIPVVYTPDHLMRNKPDYGTERSKTVYILHFVFSKNLTKEDTAVPSSLRLHRLGSTDTIKLDPAHHEPVYTHVAYTTKYVIFQNVNATTQKHLLTCPPTSPHTWYQACVYCSISSYAFIHARTFFSFQPLLWQIAHCVWTDCCQHVDIDTKARWRYAKSIPRIM